MRVVVTGSKGQLGSDVLELLLSKGIDAEGADLPKLDITDKNACMDFLGQRKPDWVVHCAAYTAVDKAETERELCRAVNSTGTENIVLACKECGAGMIYISTDYVYNEPGEHEIEETAKPSPLNWYGQTKLCGENAVIKNLDRYFIVRTSWVFGENGANFVKTMLKLGREKDEISIVCDQVGSPTYTKDLAKTIFEMLNSDRFGIYHATNSGFCSWYEFACEIFKLSGISVKAIPIPSSEYPAPATRPMNSRLSKKKLLENGFSGLPHWQDALKRFLNH